MNILAIHYPGISHHPLMTSSDNTVMLESDMCATRGLSHIIWGDSIVFDDQEIVLANEKAFELACSL